MWSDAKSINSVEEGENEINLSPPTSELMVEVVNEMTRTEIFVVEDKATVFV